MLARPFEQLLRLETPRHRLASHPRKKYLPLVSQAATREDLYALVSLMMGELNASHLGISGKMPSPDEWTADCWD